MERFFAKNFNLDNQGFIKNHLLFGFKYMNFKNKYKHVNRKHGEFGIQ